MGQKNYVAVGRVDLPGRKVMAGRTFTAPAAEVADLVKLGMVEEAADEAPPLPPAEAVAAILEMFRALPEDEMAELKRLSGELVSDVLPPGSVILLGDACAPEEVGSAEGAVSRPDLVARAWADSGLSVAAWNGLPEAERAQAIGATMTKLTAPRADGAEGGEGGGAAGAAASPDPSQSVPPADPASEAKPKGKAKGKE